MPKNDLTKILDHICHHCGCYSWNLISKVPVSPFVCQAPLLWERRRLPPLVQEPVLPRLEPAVAGSFGQLWASEPAMLSEPQLWLLGLCFHLTLQIYPLDLGKSFLFFSDMLESVTF